MIEGQSIICISQDWEGDPTSKKHIMRILSSTEPRAVGELDRHAPPTAAASDLRRLVAKLRRIVSGVRLVEPNIYVMDPPVLPLPGIRAAEQVNRIVLAARLRQLAAITDATAHHLDISAERQLAPGSPARTDGDLSLRR